MKKNLLSFAVLAGLATTAVNASEYYLIKDGKLHEGVEVLEYADEAEGTEVEEGVAAPWDGAAAVTVKPHMQYNDTRFYLSEALNYADYWNVEIEFGYEAGAVDSVAHAGGSKWAVMEIGMVDDTVGQKYGIDNSDVRNYYDVKAKNAPGQWHKENRFLYVDAFKKNFREVVFAWQRQVEDQSVLGPVYIKNLKVTGVGNRPFFYEDFNCFTTYAPAGPSAYQIYNVLDGDVNPDTYRSNKDIVTNSHSNLPVYTAYNKGAGEEQANVGIKRLFEASGTDGSEYYDTEVLHSLIMSKPVEDESGTNARTFYLVPAAGLEKAEGFTFDYLCKWNGSASDEELTEETDPELLNMNVKYAFVDDAAEAATCELNNAFGADDLLDGKWKAYHADIPNGLNGKKYIAIVFDIPVNFSYTVDNLRLAAVGENLSMVASNEPQKMDSDKKGDIIYITEYSYGPSQDGVNNILNDVKVSVFPVPATDVVTVANEGVEKVEVVNAAGAVVATANGNQVNVAAVANGIYVVKAYTAEGILVAKIVKK